MRHDKEECEMHPQLDGIGGWVTPMGAARRLGITADMVRKLIRHHHIPTVQLGKQILVRWTDLTAYRGH